MRRQPQPGPLADRIVDAEAKPLITTHASEPVPSGAEGGKVRYRYYVSQALHDARSDTGMRLPARELEALVAGQPAQVLADPPIPAGNASFAITPDWVEADRRRRARGRCGDAVHRIAK